MRRAPAAALLLFLALPACGKRGDPLPPFRRTPPALASFRLAQRGDQLEIRYTPPRSSVEGVRFTEISVETVRLDGDGDIEKQGRRARRRAIAGEEVVETEPLPAPGTVVRVAAHAIVGKELSPRAGPLVLRVQPAPVVPPETPSPSPSPGRPSIPGAAPGPPAPPTPPPFPGGFWVYRSTATGTTGYVMTAQPTPEWKLTDTRATLGARFCYTVRAVAAVDPIVESAPSNEVCVDSKDVFAPAPPAGLSALAREDGIELTWSPSPEGDLAGYRVWRTTAGQGPERLVELRGRERQHVDATATRGTTYRYTVTAFDQAGNESAHSAPAEGARP